MADGGAEHRSIEILPSRIVAARGAAALSRNHARGRGGLHMAGRRKKGPAHDGRTNGRVSRRDRAAGVRWKASPSIFGKEWSTPAVIETLARQNKPKGFMCVSCSWAKPADYHTFEFCENGAKATLVGADHARVARRSSSPKHTVTELRGWTDYDLEQQGRLTHPLRYDRGHGQIRALQLGRGVRGDRPRAEGARSEIGDLLLLGPRQPRDLLPLRACSRASTATTICPTRRTCATRPRRWR